MNDDSGVLSIDFLAGFTIFMVAFIWVATLVPGLFINLKAYPIDFDAVAYRTGVILAEDPGASGPLGIVGPQGVMPWEFQPDKRDVARFGLAVSRETPNILNANKLDRFFCASTFSYPDDYQARAIFGDFPYHFNISLNYNDESQFRSVGEIIPEDYGYIRRAITVKQTSNATINYNMIQDFGYNNTENVTFNQFVIVLNNTELLNGNIRNPAYQIDPLTDRIIINITDLEKTRSPSRQLNAIPPIPNPSGYRISAINFYQASPGQSLTSYSPPGKYMNFTYDDGTATGAINSTPVTPPVDIRNNVSLIFEPGFFSNANPDADIFINLTFGMSQPQQYLNNTYPGASPFDYNYIPTNVTQPSLKDGVLEVAVW